MNIFPLVKRILFNYTFILSLATLFAMRYENG